MRQEARMPARIYVRPIAEAGPMRDAWIWTVDYKGTGRGRYFVKRDAITAARTYCDELHARGEDAELIVLDAYGLISHVETLNVVEPVRAPLRNEGQSAAA